MLGVRRGDEHDIKHESQGSFGGFHGGRPQGPNPSGSRSGGIQVPPVVPPGTVAEAGGKDLACTWARGLSADRWRGLEHSWRGLWLSWCGLKLLWSRLGLGLTWHWLWRTWHGLGRVLPQIVQSRLSRFTGGNLNLFQSCMCAAVSSRCSTSSTNTGSQIGDLILPRLSVKMMTDWWGLKVGPRWVLMWRLIYSQKENKPKITQHDRQGKARYDMA